MNKIICLFLTIGFFSIYSEELYEKPPSSELALNEFAKGNEIPSPPTGELSSEAVGKDNPILQASVPKKNAIYFFPSLTSIVLPGVAFRHRFNDYGFLEVSYINTKQADIDLCKYEGSVPVEKLKHLGTIYDNILSTSYGFIRRTGYVDPYFSLGLGGYLPYTRYENNVFVDVLPTLCTAVGFEFEYGFLDLSIGYLPAEWTGVFDYQASIEEYLHEHPEISFGHGSYTIKQSRRWIADLRFGVGVSF